MFFRDTSKAKSWESIESLSLRPSFPREAKFPHLSVSPLEQQESLEQLRALWHGYAIAVHICEQAPEAGVDTPEDLARVRAYFANRSHLKHAT